MYVHVGQDAVIRTKDIIGIFDLDNTTVSKVTREMLRTNEQNGNIIVVGADIPKSFIVCAKSKKEQKLLISPVTPSTLTKRIQKKIIGQYRE